MLKFHHIALVGSLCLGVSFSARAEDELTVGINGAGRLVPIEVNFGPVMIEASVFPGLTGFATGLVGFHSAELPGPDFFPLSSTADVIAVMISIDSGFNIYNDAHLMAPGDFVAFGPEPFDNHPLFHIPAGNPGDLFSATFYLHDRSGAYTDSVPFTMTFTPIPGPSTAVGLAGVGLLAARRRR